MPFFSIIIPTYNRSSLLPRAIDSVLQQTFTDFELIVVDDGSTDATQQLVRNYADNRVRYVYQDNKGVCVARNHGVALANAPYLVFLDSDDYALEDWLANFHKSISNFTIDMVFCDMLRVNCISNSSTIIKANDPYQKKTYSEEGFFMSGVFCLKKSVFNNVGGFDITIKYGEFTDLAFSLKEFNLTKRFTNKASLVYEVSVNGGSKNIHNKVAANLYLLKKHSNLFKQSPNVKRFFLQNIAVAYVKLKSWKNAQIYFWKAYSVQPWKFKTLVRLGISFFPVIAKRIWKETH